MPVVVDLELIHSPYQVSSYFICKMGVDNHCITSLGEYNGSEKLQTAKEV